MFRSVLRPVAALAALSGLAAYATIMLRGPQGIVVLNLKHREIRTLQEQIDRLAHDIEMKKLRIKQLQSNPSAQEVELQRMGFLHQHDTQFKTPDKSVQATPPPDSEPK